MTAAELEVARMADLLIVAWVGVMFGFVVGASWAGRKA